MKVYKGIVKTHALYKKILVLVACVILLYIEYNQKQWFYVPLTLILMLSVFHHKEHIISEEGVDIRYSLLGLKSINRWTWDQITGIQPDYIKARPNARLTIEKGSMLRSFLFTPEDCRACIKLAAKMNPDMFIDDYTAEEQEEIEKEKQRIQERMRAQRAQAKRKKKKS